MSRNNTAANKQMQGTSGQKQFLAEQGAAPHFASSDVSEHSASQDNTPQRAQPASAATVELSEQENLFLSLARNSIDESEKAFKQDQPPWMDISNKLDLQLKLLLLVPPRFTHFWLAVNLAYTNLQLKNMSKVNELLAMARDYRNQLSAEEQKTFLSHPFVKERFQALSNQSVTPAVTVTEETQIKTRNALLAKTPFLNFDHLVLAFNQARDEDDQNKIDALRAFILNLIEALSPNQPGTLLQSVALLGCGDKIINNALVEHLLQLIDSVKLSYPPLFNALSLVLQENRTTGDHTGNAVGTDLMAVVSTLTGKMNTLHSPDIQYTAVVVNTLFETLYAILVGKIANVSKETHLKLIEDSLQSLKNRLSGVRRKLKKQGKQGHLDPEVDLSLAALEQSIDYGFYALTQIEDHRTPWQRKLHHAKTAGRLILQGLGVAGAVTNACLDGGIGASDALTKTIDFIGACFKRAVIIRRYFKHRKPCFKALRSWQEQFDALLLEDSQIDEAKIKTIIKDLCHRKAGETKSGVGSKPEYRHPYFQWGVVSNFMSASEHYPAMRPYLAQLLLSYYLQAPEGNEDYQQVRLYARHALVTANDAGYFADLKLSETVDAMQPVIAQGAVDAFQVGHGVVTAAELKALSKDTANQKEASAKFIERLWREKYTGDSNLFAFLTVRPEDTRKLSARLDVIKQLKSGVDAITLSHWGQQVLDTFSVDLLLETSRELQEVSYAFAVIGLNFVLPSAKDFTVLSSTEQASATLTSLVKAGAESVEKIKVNDDTKDYLNQHFDKLFNATVETAKAIRYEQTVEGARLTIRAPGESHTEIALPGQSGGLAPGKR